MSIGTFNEFGIPQAGRLRFDDLGDVEVAEALDGSSVVFRNQRWVPYTPITKHSGLSGLDKDDHPQYMKKADYVAPTFNHSALQNLYKNAAQQIVDDHPQYLLKTSAVTVHNQLSGRDANDHPQYVTHSEYGMQITDWNYATENGIVYMAPDAANGPGAGWWIGYTLSHNPIWHVQRAVQFTNSPFPADTWFQRAKLNGAWTGWSRQGIYIRGTSTWDTMMYADHDGVRRSAWGIKKDAGSAGATDADEWRVQCYNTGGAFTWSAIKIPENGVVSMPRGHGLTMRSLSGDGEAPAIQADTAATIGVVLQLLSRAFSLAGLDFTPDAVARMIEPPPEEE